MLKWIISAVVIGGVGYLGYGYYRAGMHTAPPVFGDEFLLSFKSGFRGVMSGVGPRQTDRKYLAYQAKDVPSWYQESWSICRAPTPEELASYEANTDIGPGGRWEAVCEIDADGDVFIRGWIASVPDL